MEPVVISGLGVISPLGHSMDELTRRFEAGERAASVDGCVSVSEVPLEAIPADTRGRIGRLDRLCRFFLAASFLAVDAAGLVIAPDEAERVGLSFGTGLGCLLTNEEYYRKIVEQGPAAASPRLFAYTVSSAAAGEVSIALGIKGPNVTTHMGLAAGLGAVGYGFDLIQMGKADVILAGGADVVGPALVQGLRDMGLLKTAAAARPFEDAMPGMLPAEGAVVAVLERRDRALARGARCWARVDGYAAGFEASLASHAPQPTALVETARRALQLSGHVACDVDVVMVSAHGTPVDRAERAALDEVFGRDDRPRRIAPKAVLGDAFGASGVLALALAVGQMAEPRAIDVSGPPRRAPVSVAMVQALCYSGTTVNLLLARDV